MSKSILVLVLFSCMLLVATTAADTPPAEETDVAINDISALKQYFREEALNLREEMYSLFSERQGAALLALQIMDLVREVKDVVDSVKKLEGKMDAISAEQEGIISSLAGARSDLSTKLTNVGVQVTNVNSKVTRVGGKLDVMRSEVRLISQHKLTWQNSTWDNTYHPDFVVDGVYTLVEGHSGSSSNPMQKSGRETNQKGNMLLIDLGGFFKIHTIKLWNRLDTNQSFALGVLIFADEQLIGSIHDIQRLYTFRANDDVYGRKIYVKQSLAKYINFIEIQVFGSGPYSEDEL